MQKVMLIGNLGRDPEVKYSQQGTAIAQFCVATTERWKDKDGELQQHTEWFAVKAFNRLAEIAGEHLHKGSRIYAEGRKRTESWDDNQTGAKHYRDLVCVDRIEFLDSKGGGNGNGETAESASDETTVTAEDVPFWQTLSSPASISSFGPSVGIAYELSRYHSLSQQLWNAPISVPRAPVHFRVHARAISRQATKKHS